MLCTLLRPTEGSARVGGYDILKQPSEIRRHIGLVAERIILYERLTAEENLILFGRLNHLLGKVIRERIDTLLKLLHMEEWRGHLTGTFSTGMKQRMNIARALLHQPDILFLDEPTLGLDPQTTRSLHTLIQGLGTQGITIVLTTHIMSEAEALSQRIAIIDHGRIVALDTPQGLKKSLSQDGAQIVDIDITHPSEGLLSALNNLEHVTSLICKEECHIKLHISGNGALYHIVDTIRRHDSQIRAINTALPSLEDVFLHLTGHEMRNEATEKVPSGKVSHRARHAQRKIR